MSIKDLLIHSRFWKKNEDSLYTYVEYMRRKNQVASDLDLGGNVRLYYFRLSDNSKAGDHPDNLGDYLSKIIVNHYKPEKIRGDSDRPARTMYGIGSLLGFRCQNAVIWGSGISSPDKLTNKRIRMSRLDIRAVRGPKTRAQLIKLGKSCPEVYGDPAVLMPEIYMPDDKEKRFPVSVIFHHVYNKFAIPDGLKPNIISMITNDYRSVISQIVRSELVISSSLHGVILAEVYGVPAVLLLKENQQTFKYEDWYNSTGRYNITIAHSVEEALLLTPMPIPDLSSMRESLKNAFPSDLWD